MTQEEYVAKKLAFYKTLDEIWGDWISAKIQEIVQDEFTVTREQKIIILSDKIKSRREILTAIKNEVEIMLNELY